ncbi:MAG: methionyl-tRNA formyltransferase [Thermacetogeniaceae bacterium]
MDILFLGTSDFAIPALELLASSRWRLLGVVTQPDRPRGRGRKLGPSPVKQFALDRRLTVYQPESGAGLADLLATENLRPSVIVVVAFGQLLKKAVLELPPLGCINIHPSLLPAYRGPAPIQRAIMNGETRTGVTTMYLSPEMDAGDVILQEAVMIEPGTTSGELSARLDGLGAEMLCKTLSLVERGGAPRLAQDQRRATYAPALTPGEERIDWSWDAVSLCNLIRGMNPSPGAHTLFNGKGLKIWRSRPGGGTPDGDSGGRPGTVSDADPRSGFTVQTGRGQLVIESVQPAGRSSMSAAEFVRGYRVRPGLLLGG